MNPDNTDNTENMEDENQEVIYFQIDSPFGAEPFVFINNAVINDINRDRQGSFITVTYDVPGQRRGREQLVLVVGRNTRIQDPFGRQIGIQQLRPGTNIDAVVSSAWARSFPPQANAFLIIVNERRRQNQFAEGRIVNINYRRNVFAIEQGGRGNQGGPGPVVIPRPGGNQGGPGPVVIPVPGGPGPVEFFRPGGGNRGRIRFLVDQNTRIIDRNGRPNSFWSLQEGTRVRVEYQSFNDPDRGQINLALVIRVQ